MKADHCRLLKDVEYLRLAAPDPVPYLKIQKGEIVRYSESAEHGKIWIHQEGIHMHIPRSWVTFN